jgi:2-C-methyl-D-erythritol 4-phosphate cytidylyltransferase
VDNTAYLVTPAKYLKRFIHVADRDYFSRPVLVELRYSEVSTRFVIVHDPNRGHTYPADAKNLVSVDQLSNRERALVAIHGGINV